MCAVAHWPCKFAVALASGSGSAHPLRGSWAPLCCPQLVPGEEAWACAGRPADQWAFHPRLEVGHGVEGPRPGSEGCWCALPHSWGGPAVLTTRTGGHRRSLSRWRGGRPCLWSHGRRGPDLRGPEALRPELPRDLGRPPALRPHVHTSRLS